MRTKDLKFIISALVAGAMAPTMLHAAQINGGISFGGSYVPKDNSDNVISDLTVAAKLIPTGNVVIQVNGDFSSIPAFTPTTSAAELDINPPTVPVGPVWSVGGFSLTLSSIIETNVTGNTLELDGSGILHSTNAALEDTPCFWIATFNNAGGTFTWSSSSGAVPSACNCSLTFNAPNLTNCAGDPIPAVTASQDCGSGPVNVPVTLIRVTTNGTCPMIVTRSYTATTDCGTVKTATQTITINCKPDCTITPSVTTAAVGGSNYTAQVANAGVGATYVWTVLNGSITAGQGTPMITWSAGTDTNSPISIIVMVTAATGCQSACSASVKLPPQPCSANICGHVFADCDGNGDLTAGDVGISNIVVSLYDSANHLLGKTTSDKNGGYCFNNLSGGSYVVSITPPSGYSQTAASTSYHWKDSYGRTCWQENDGYIHCLSSGYECWWDKSNTCHWKDSYNRDCWKDNWGITHCQPLSYKSCNAQTNNNCISVTLTNCTSQTDVDFAYTGTKPSLSVSCSGPSYVKCGQSYNYTCTIVNNGNVCFKGGNVCTTIGNCNSWGGWNYGCNNYTANCPPLSPGQKCTITVKCSFNSWNCGTVGCQSQVSCNSNYGNWSGQSYCYSQCGW